MTQVEKCVIFLDWKNQQYQNHYTTKVIYKLNAIPIKLPILFSADLEQEILKSVWKNKSPQIVHAILRKKNGAGEISLPDFRLYQKATEIKQCSTGTKTDLQINGTGEINPHTYGQLI